MGVLLTEVLHGGLEGDGHVSRLHVTLIEGLHELRGAMVVDVPKGEQERGGAGTEEAALQAKELVASGDEIHAGGAAA